MDRYWSRPKWGWGGAVRFDTGSDDYLGWIIAEKLVPDIRILEVLADEPDHPAAVREKRKIKTPYWIQILELDREVHESGVYETGTDYRRKENHWFETSAQAAAFLLEHGISTDDLRDPREVDAP